MCKIKMRMREGVQNDCIEMQYGDQVLVELRSAIKQLQRNKATTKNISYLLKKEKNQQHT